MHRESSRDKLHTCESKRGAATTFAHLCARFFEVPRSRRAAFKPPLNEDRESGVGFNSFFIQTLLNAPNIRL